MLSLLMFAVAPAQAQSVERYVRMFERIAFYNESGPVRERPTFDRWEHLDGVPALVLVRLVGDDHGHRSVVEERLEDLGRLTGLEARLVGPSDPANVLMRFAEVKLCMGEIRSGEPVWLTIGLRSPRHCIAEELAQTLALGNDSCIIRDSIFCESEFRETYSTADEILIRTAFDKRLHAGMPKAEAMALVPQIVRDLLKEAGLPVIERDPPPPAPNDALALP